MYANAANAFLGFVAFVDSHVIRIIRIVFLSLSLFMFRILADDIEAPFAAHDLTILAHCFDGTSDLHK